jgi:hypothetical protein
MTILTIIIILSIISKITFIFQKAFNCQGSSDAIALHSRWPWLKPRVLLYFIGFWRTNQVSLESFEIIINSK